MGGRLAGGPGADDDKIEPVHPRNHTHGGLARSLRRDEESHNATR
jgi:hypothetical protein